MENTWFTRYKKRLTYLASFSLPILIMLLVWAVNGAFPFGNKSLMAVDFGQQYIGFYAYLKKTVLTGDWSAFLYSFEKSIGGEMIGVLGYYLMSPFNIFYILLPLSQFKWAVVITIALRYGFMGLTFSHLLIKRYQALQGQTWLVPLMAASYALSGMLVSYQMNPIFYDAMIMLPLVILYLEETLDGGKPFKYAITLAFTMLLQFYMGYMICLFVALYAIAYMLPKWAEQGTIKEKAKQFFFPLFKVVAYSILAATSTFVTLYPIILNLLRSKGAYNAPMLFEWKLQITPLDILAKLTIGAFDNESWPAGPNLPNIYVGALALLGSIYFFRYAQVHWTRKIGFTVIVGIFLISFVHEFTSKIWHMGQNPAGFFYRFSWIFSFFMVLIAYQTLKNSHKVKWYDTLIGAGLASASLYYVATHDFSFLEDKQLPALTDWVGKNTLAVLALFSLLFLLISCAYWFNSRAHFWQKSLHILFGAGFTVGSFFLIKQGYLLTQVTLTGLTWLSALLFYTYKPKSIGRFVLASITIFELGLNAYISQSRIGYTDAYKFSDLAVKLDTLGNTVDELSDHPFYRIGTDFFYSKNDPVLGSYNSLSNFSSSLERSTINLMASMGDMGGNASTFYTNGTILTDTLFGVRYHVARKPYTNEDVQQHPKTHFFSKTSARKDITSYYNLIKEDDTFLYYENPNVISLAYGTNDVTHNIKFGTNNPVSNQNIILKSMSGQDYEFFVHAAFNDIKLDNLELDNSNGQKIYRRLDKTKPGKISFTFVPQTNWTYYFQAPYSLRKSMGKMNIMLNGQWYNYTQMFDQVQLWQIAHQEAGKQITFEISTSSEDEINLTNYSLVRADTEAIQQVMTNRLAQSMTVDKMTNTQIDGSVNITDDSTLMMTSIPYNPGWTVTVDGKEVKTTEAWGSLLSFPITQGKHQIKLTFKAQGLVTGLAISLGSMLMLLFLYLFDKLKKKSKDLS
ncbi:glycosyltransferase PgfM1 [Streptococcus sp. S784/96/1]|uniref:glycosyltransferase PgfM1 n=1 Tax=Streptococcus sp. S784/96/1 TaxID=2653499 RepID=UPI0013894177|nr:YfhO family protein [Streptococcus sp. S784/96/1]